MPEAGGVVVVGWMELDGGEGWMVSMCTRCSVRAAKRQSKIEEKAGDMSRPHPPQNGKIKKKKGGQTKDPPAQKKSDTRDEVNKARKEEEEKEEEEEEEGDKGRRRKRAPSNRQPSVAVSSLSPSSQSPRCCWLLSTAHETTIAPASNTRQLHAQNHTAQSHGAVQTAY